MNEYENQTLYELEHEASALKGVIEKLQESLQKMQKALDNKRGVLWFDPWLAPEGYAAVPANTCSGCAFIKKNGACTSEKEPCCTKQGRPDRNNVIFIPLYKAVKQWTEQSRIEHGVLLDGEKARACRKSDGLWIVRRQDGKGGDVEYSDMAVKYTLLEDKGRFVST